MSGGHFDYAQSRITDIYESIGEQIKKNGKPKDEDELDSWDIKTDNLNHYKYPDNVVEEMKNAVQALKVAQIYTQRVDWLLSGDDGEETFIERLKNDLDELELKDWDVTLNDGLENEPYVSDDFQIGSDGAYEHTEEWNTSPREKAKELVDKFSPHSYCGACEEDDERMRDYHSKQCALVMVDEIKRILYDQDLMIRYDYWFEVKKEIENYGKII